ncbi:MAG: 30S ribosomal protein S4 [Chloroflexi bacterium]|nr:30S ribosomal protein S4 [Chloroflexota bacterium]
MGRYLGPVCRLCRREGEKLYLKGAKCFTEKCPFERRKYPPGQHGRMAALRRSRESDFAKQLRAKQRAKRIYGVSERQFRRYFDAATQRRGLTGLNLLQILESRLDNVVYRLGFARSRAEARQLVTHGHFTVNGRRTDVPSYLLSPGDVVAVREGSRKRRFFQEIIPEWAAQRSVPAWLERDLDNLSGRVLRLPERGEIDATINEQLIVEYYSR